MSNHRVRIEWMGEIVETLDDLLRRGLRVVCVGINPAPVSVAAGHYYQGRLGARFWERLRIVGLLPRGEGWNDDTAFAAGIGFTDIVKRPTSGASEVAAEELVYGREVLRTKLDRYRPGIVVFVFKRAATAFLGPFPGNGFIGHTINGMEVFVMPGPMEERVSATKTLAMLRQRVNA